MAPLLDFLCKEYQLLGWVLVSINLFPLIMLKNCCVIQSHVLFLCPQKLHCVFSSYFKKTSQSGTLESSEQNVKYHRSVSNFQFNYLVVLFFLPHSLFSWIQICVNLFSTFTESMNKIAKEVLLIHKEKHLKYLN